MTERNISLNMSINTINNCTFSLHFKSYKKYHFNNFIFILSVINKYENGIDKKHKRENGKHILHTTQAARFHHP